MSVRIALVAAMVLAGCGFGEGKGALAGTLYVRNCTSDEDFGQLGGERQYDMKPSYFIASAVDDFDRPNPMNRLTIRIQPTGNRVEEADAFLITIASVREVAAQLASDIPVGASTNLRAALMLNQTCPKAEVRLELDGKINFTKFGGASTTEQPPIDFRIQTDDQLAATFEFVVTDRRALVLGGTGAVSPEPAASGQLAGNFEFVVRQGRVAQSP
jgi:hypothetical protein